MSDESMEQGYRKKAKEMLDNLFIFRGTSALAVLLALEEHPGMNSHRISWFIQGKGSTVIYKAVKLMLKQGFIISENGRLLLTFKGKRTIDMMKEILEESDEAPGLEQRWSPTTADTGN